MYDWQAFIAEEQGKPYFQDLQRAIEAEKTSGKVVYPPDAEVFSAFRQTQLNRINVIILGQDPYHGPGQAHGMSFSVPNGIAPPPSLQNIFKELALSDASFVVPQHGNLSAWAQQGVLLLNTVLTVNQGAAHSHAKFGWQTFTLRAMQTALAHNKHVVLMLWGAHAQNFVRDLDVTGHCVLKAPHPSPLSAHRGFLGCQHFAKANQWLKQKGRTLINWQLADGV
jgi:uracil-DNA glycosylase